jgi:hypothetical protein
VQVTCSKCGYDVTTLVANGLEKCPECGTRAAWADPTNRSGRGGSGRRRWVRQAGLLVFGLGMPLVVVPVFFLMVPDPPPGEAVVEGAVCVGASWGALVFFALGRRGRVSGVGKGVARGSRVVGAIAVATMNTFLAWASVFVVCMVAWG